MGPYLIFMEGSGVWRAGVAIHSPQAYCPRSQTNINGRGTDDKIHFLPIRNIGGKPSSLDKEKSIV